MPEYLKNVHFNPPRQLAGEMEGLNIISLITITSHGLILHSFYYRT
jgi:hypothetical protein